MDEDLCSYPLAVSNKQMLLGGKMSQTNTSSGTITRRRFLKAGCLAAAAGGMTVCGVGLVIPEPLPIELSSYMYGEKNMPNRVLVAYASATGSTVNVAAEIGKTLSTADIYVDVKPVQEVSRLSDYQAVLVGSAVQHGSWLPEAVNFVTANQEILNCVPVALFTVHIQNTGDDEASRQNRLAYLSTVRPLLQPVDEVFFAGKFDRQGAALLLPRWIAWLIPSIDLRNWKKIRGWANDIRPQLLTQA